MMPIQRMMVNRTLCGPDKAVARLNLLNKAHGIISHIDYIFPPRRVNKQSNMQTRMKAHVDGTGIKTTLLMVTTPKQQTNTHGHTETATHANDWHASEWAP